MEKKLSSSSFKVSVAPESGADATTYWLVPSTTQVKRKADGIHLPEYVSCECFSKTGNGNPVSGGGTIKFVLIFKTGSVSTEFLYKDRYKIASDIASISFRLYVGGTQVDEKTVAVIDDGQQGETGVRGRMPFPSGTFDLSATYTATDSITPIVYYEAGRTYYVMNKTRTVTGLNPADDYAANGSNATWIPFENYKAIFTEILMANFAKLASAVFHGDCMFSQHGKDASGNDTTNYSAFDPAKIGKADCPFTPNLMMDMLLGKFIGTDMDIQGGRIGGFDINKGTLDNIGDRNANIRIRTEKDLGLDENNERQFYEAEASLGNQLPQWAGVDTNAIFRSSGKRDKENVAIHAAASGSTKKYNIIGGYANLVIKAIGGTDWNMESGDHWCMPGFLCCCSCDKDLNEVHVWGNGACIQRVERGVRGSYTIWHNLGHTEYMVIVQTTPSSEDGYAWTTGMECGRYTGRFDIQTIDTTRGPRNIDFRVFVFGRPANK